MSELEFKGFKTTETKDGYRVGVDAYRKLMKEKGIPAEVIDQIGEAEESLIDDMLDWVTTRVEEELRPIELEIAKPGNKTIWASVDGVRTYPGIPRTGENGEKIPAVPVVKYGSAAFGVTQAHRLDRFKEKKTEISTRVENAFKAAEKTKKTAA